MTQPPKRGRPAGTPDINRVVSAIATGEYDDQLLDLGFAIEKRREFLKGQLLDQVRKLFGDNVADQIGERRTPLERLFDKKPAPSKPNPFVNKAKREPPPLASGDDYQPDALAVGTSMVESLNKGELAPIESRGAIIGGLASSDIGD